MAAKIKIEGKISVSSEIYKIYFLILFILLTNSCNFMELKKI
jgi:hypothetical protein